MHGDDVFIRITSEQFLTEQLNSRVDCSSSGHFFLEAPHFFQELLSADNFPPTSHEKFENGKFKLSEVNFFPLPRCRPLGEIDR